MKQVGKAMFWAFCCSIFVMFAFMLGEGLVYKPYSYQKIVLDDIDQIAYATEGLSKHTNKVLVPEGLVTSTNETDVVYLRYKVYVKEGDITAELATKIEFIIDDQGTDLTEYFDITKSTLNHLKEPLYLTYEVRLKKPSSSQVYEQLAAKTLSVKVKFWFLNE